MVSKNATFIAAGASVTFDWTAEAGGDWYDCYGKMSMTGDEA